MFFAPLLRGEQGHRRHGYDMSTSRAARTALPGSDRHHDSDRFRKPVSDTPVEGTRPPRRGKRGIDERGKNFILRL